MKCFGTFQIGSELFSVEIERLQEIVLDIEITKVPHAPNHVLGLTNLRGRIIPILSLHDEDRTIGGSKFFVILKHEEELLGLLVDAVHDVIEINENQVDEPPSHLSEDYKQFISGVHQHDGQLIRIFEVPSFLASILEHQR